MEPALCAALQQFLVSSVDENGSLVLFQLVSNSLHIPWVDRVGNGWTVFDIDGTREAARQRALPQTDDLPSAFRRLDDVCAAGYTGRKRGQTVRTRTTVSQAHTYHWLGSFGNKGNGQYREELRQGLCAIGRYLTAYQLDHRSAGN